MEILNPHKIYISRHSYYSAFDRTMDTFISILDGYVEEVSIKKYADFHLNDHHNNYILDKEIKPLPINYLDFYAYYIPKKEFNGAIFDSAYKMLISKDVDSMKLGVDLLFFMDRPPDINGLDIPKIRRLFVSKGSADQFYHMKSLMIAHNYED